MSQIFISSSDGKEIQPLVERAQIQSLHPPLYFEVYTDKPRLYWKNGILDLPTIGIEQSIWYYDFETNITDNITSQDDSFPEIAIAPSGNRVIVSNEAGNWLMDWDFQQIRRLPIEGVPQGMFWSPSGKFLLMQVTPENSGSENGDLYLWEVNTLFANKIGTTSGMPIAFWSPDEQYVALLMFDTTNNLLEIRPILLNVDNLSLVPLFDKLDLGEVPFLYIHWISDEMAS